MDSLSVWDAQRQADYEKFSVLAADYFATFEFDLAEVAIGNALKNAPAAGADLASAARLRRLPKINVPQPDGPRLAV